MGILAYDLDSASSCRRSLEPRDGRLCKRSYRSHIDCYPDEMEIFDNALYQLVASAVPHMRITGHAAWSNNRKRFSSY